MSMLWMYILSYRVRTASASVSTWVPVCHPTGVLGMKTQEVFCVVWLLGITALMWGTFVTNGPVLYSTYIQYGQPLSMFPLESMSDKLLECLVWKHKWLSNNYHITCITFYMAYWTLQPYTAHNLLHNELVSLTFWDPFQWIVVLQIRGECL